MPPVQGHHIRISPGGFYYDFQPAKSNGSEMVIGHVEQ